MDILTIPISSLQEAGGLAAISGSCFMIVIRRERLRRRRQGASDICRKWIAGFVDNFFMAPALIFGTEI
jgi:hypothetical protein